MALFSSGDLRSSLTENHHDDGDDHHHSAQHMDPLLASGPPDHASHGTEGSSNHHDHDDDDDEGEDTFETNSVRHRRPRWVKYLYAVSRLLLVDVLLERTGADDPSVLSALVKVTVTGTSYVLLYTTALASHLMWGIAYLMDHGYWMLAASGCVTLLCVSVILLLCYEWMWRWQERVFDPLVLGNCCCRDVGNHADDYEVLGTIQQEPQQRRRRRRRPVVVHDEEDMEDDLSLRGWAKRFARILGFCLVWMAYCVVNIKVDFFITDLYIMARPEHYRFELLLVNCFEAAPILIGAAVFMHFAYPPFFQWHAPAPTNGVIAIAHVDQTPTRRHEESQGGLQSLL
jgi:hypothetical protein